MTTFEYIIGAVIAGWVFLKLLKAVFGFFSKTDYHRDR